MATATAKPLAEPVHAVDLALGALVRYERPDLEARLRQAKDRLLTDQSGYWWSVSSKRARAC